MADACIGRSADKFIGDCRSSVAAFMAPLKDWNTGDCILNALSRLLVRISKSSRRSEIALPKLTLNMLE
jgi:hypothetical protein